MRKHLYRKLIDGILLQRIDHMLFYDRRLQRVIKKGKQIVRTLSSNDDYKVLNGVFSGLKYPSLTISEAALVPKIIGSYEYQLQPWFRKIIETNYTDIIDVGSAEGYYAVGLATKMPNTTVHCYDINEKDINFSKQMAEINNVRNMTWNTYCDDKTLMNFQRKGKTLIICDCEGFELQLFTDQVIQHCKDVDMLIELHDVVNPIISSTLLSRFQSTHTFSVVNNSNVHYDGITGVETLSAKEKEFAMCEHRGGLFKNTYMEWVFLTPKNAA